MTWGVPFLDGFDHYATADIGAKWDAVASGGNVTIDSTIFRNSGKALKISAAGATYAIKGVTPSRNICLGFGHYCTAIPSDSTVAGSNGHSILGLSSANTYGAGTLGQVFLSMLNDGKLHAGRGSAYAGGASSATDLGAGTTVFTQNTWYYIEVRVFIDSSAGQIEVRVNGVVDINLTGINTQAQTANTVSSLQTLSYGSGVAQSRYFDDLYLRTGSSGSAESGGFLGDISVKPYYPNADGTYTAMTCSTGSTHNTLVDETTPNTSDYVSSATALTKDSYGFQDVSGSGAIKAVQLNAYASKNDSGFRGLDLFCRSSSTEDFTAYNALSTTWRYMIKGWLQDPNTSADWSQAGFNAAEFGVRVSADL
jgi:hypothetical protein